ncbi:MAG: non-homologous end-joining DNA ligase [Candidatus Dormibacteraceae bacterium]
MIGDQLQIDLGGFPTALRPMQAVSAEGPFSSDEYLFEVKWDGMRCLLFVAPDGEVSLQDRNLGDVTAGFPELAAASSRQVPPGTILDGEVVATDDEGRPDYDLLRRRLEGGPRLKDRIPLAFLAFDILHSGGHSLLRQHLIRRKTNLKRSVTTGGLIFVPDHIRAGGLELFEACLDRGLEGVVAKHRQSPYVPGQRSPLWLKVKAVQSDDFVVVGWTAGEPFGALLVAYFDEGRLLPCGTVGGGYDRHTARALRRALESLETPDSPLQPAPVMTGSSVHWCRPELVISVRYSEWAPDGTLRFPIFNGLRLDVHRSECVRHQPQLVITGRGRQASPASWLTRFPF